VSKPAAATADASLYHVAGARVGKSVPTALEWLRQKHLDTPEEDLVRDALHELLTSRGDLPAHAPSEIAAKLVRKRFEERRCELASAQADLQRREEQFRERSRSLQDEREKQRLAEEELQKYPRPAWLENCEGTINMAVVGNSGVGKSLLINKFRRVRPGTEHWAPVGVKETTLRPTMYIFPGVDRVRLWDLPGAGTAEFPQSSYISTMGLRYFDSVLIVSAGRFTETEMLLRGELQEYGVPFHMVRTKVDLDVWNNEEDNGLSEATTLAKIRDEHRDQHGSEGLYLVSLRDTERYDFRALRCNAFPGLKNHLQAIDFLFPSTAQGDCSGNWGDGWQMPELLPPAIAGIQGQWRDFAGTQYIIDGWEGHITCTNGETAIVELDENDGWMQWCGRWRTDLASVREAAKSSELRWAPMDLTLRPLVWRWDG